MNVKKLIMFNLVTIDGFFAGPNGEIDWHNVDDEFTEFAIDQLDSADGLLFGRITYQLMANYWPTPDAARQAPGVAARMNSISKVVVSRSLTNVEWRNTRLVKDNFHEDLSELKRQPGKDLLLLGSAELGSNLANLGLIDEYRIMFNPIVLGRGKPLFKNIDHRLALKLLATREFRSGNVLCRYSIG
jgi:dihydrofolate reductase